MGVAPGDRFGALRRLNSQIGRDKGERHADSKTYPMELRKPDMVESELGVQHSCTALDMRR